MNVIEFKCEVINPEKCVTKVCLQPNLKPILNPSYTFLSWSKKATHTL